MIVTRGLGLPESTLVASGLGRAGERSILTGDATLNGAGGSLLGFGSLGVAKSTNTSGGGGNFSHKLPDPFAIIAEARRAQKAAAEALILRGDVSLVSPPSELSGQARIKRVALVASSCTMSSGTGEVVGRDATIYDVELEMLALLLAA